MYDRWYEVRPGQTNSLSSFRGFQTPLDEPTHRARAGVVDDGCDRDRYKRPRRCQCEDFIARRRVRAREKRRGVARSEQLIKVDFLHFFTRQQTTLFHTRGRPPRRVARHSHTTGGEEEDLEEVIETDSDAIGTSLATRRDANPASRGKHRCISVSEETRLRRFRFG